jgi:predicted RNA-binding protein with PIN domain
MPEQWLIDGYNLLHSLRTAHPHRSLTREGLFTLVSGFASFKNVDVLLVLDGTGPEAELDAHATARFRAVFSQKGPADAYIERVLFEERSKKRLVVVTDDRAIANIGRGGGAQVVSTQGFNEMLKGCARDRSDILDGKKAKGHGFHRPFDDKLKDL